MYYLRSFHDAKPVPPSPLTQNPSDATAHMPGSVYAFLLFYVSYSGTLRTDDSVMSFQRVVHDGTACAMPTDTGRYGVWSARSVLCGQSVHYRRTTHCDDLTTRLTSLITVTGRRPHTHIGRPNNPLTAWASPGL